jgi:hypothetical protein
MALVLGIFGMLRFFIDDQELETFDCEGDA